MDTFMVRFLERPDDDDVGRDPEDPDRTVWMSRATCDMVSVFFFFSEMWGGEREGEGRKKMGGGEKKGREEEESEYDAFLLGLGLFLFSSGGILFSVDTKSLIPSLWRNPLSSSFAWP